MRTLANSEDCAVLATRLGSVIATDARRWGRMSAHQMLCHVADSFLFALGKKPVKAVAGYLPRTALKSLALYFPMKWPRNVPTRPELNQHSGGTPPTDFELDRQRALDLFHQFLDEANLAQQPHPMFGSMSRNNWLRWGYLHTDHHLRQFGR